MFDKDNFDVKIDVQLLIEQSTYELLCKYYLTGVHRYVTR